MSLRLTLTLTLFDIKYCMSRIHVTFSGLASKFRVGHDRYVD